MFFKKSLQYWPDAHRGRDNNDSAASSRHRQAVGFTSLAVVSGPAKIFPNSGG
jgi:hypothetical protein